MSEEGWIPTDQVKALPVDEGLRQLSRTIDRFMALEQALEVARMRIVELEDELFDMETQRDMDVQYIRHLTGVIQNLKREREDV